MAMEECSINEHGPGDQPYLAGEIALEVAYHSLGEPFPGNLSIFFRYMW